MSLFLKLLLYLCTQAYRMPVFYVLRAQVKKSDERCCNDRLLLVHRYLCIQSPINNRPTTDRPIKGPSTRKNGPRNCKRDTMYKFRSNNQITEQNRSQFEVPVNKFVTQISQTNQSKGEKKGRERRKGGREGARKTRISYAYAYAYKLECMV